MENADRPDPAEETFAQVLAALKDEYRASDTSIAEALGLHVSTVNNWANGKALPRQKALAALGDVYRPYRERLFAAAGKKVPAPLPPDRKAAVLDVFDRLTQEQQDMLLIQAKAVADSNDQ
ncbi:helix-turn-helix domain-containing protein [Streptomyces sp. NPDC057257]|uniref:helix-turn-helix domain-containing protein n=1 Tax=Streptomyces sp. NPDC057257 TaxID=3346071 RepID=UPI00362A2AFC